MILFQAFSLPVIQIVHETVREALSGRKTSRPADAATSTGMTFIAQDHAAHVAGTLYLVCMNWRQLTIC